MYSNFQVIWICICWPESYLVHILCSILVLLNLYLLESRKDMCSWIFIALLHLFMLIFSCLIRSIEFLIQTMSILIIVLIFLNITNFNKCSLLLNSNWMSFVLNQITFDCALIFTNWFWLCFPTVLEDIMVYWLFEWLEIVLYILPDERSRTDEEHCDNCWINIFDLKIDLKGINLVFIEKLIWKSIQSNLCCGLCKWLVK